MPTIPDSLSETPTRRPSAAGPRPGGATVAPNVTAAPNAAAAPDGATASNATATQDATAALDTAAALWAAKAQAAAALAAPPDPAGFPDPQAFADALANWRDALQAAAEDALENRPPALEAWRAWFAAETERLAPHLEQAALAAAMQRAGAALRQELDAARDRALAPAREGDAAAASGDARAALEQAAALGVLDPEEAERTARGLAAQVQAGLAAGQADQDPAGFLKALGAGDFPALDKGEQERLAGRARLRLALAQAQAAQDAAQAAEDARRLPAERGRLLLRRAEAALRVALAGEGDPAVVLDAARELAALPGFAGPAQELVKSLESLPAARALLAQTEFAPPAARFAALESAMGQAPDQAPDQARGDGRKPAPDEIPGHARNLGRSENRNPARAWPAPLLAACREVLEESAGALAADPAGYVRPEAERRLKAAGLDPAAEPEALRHAVLDLQAQAGVERPGVLSLAEAAALRQEWRARDAAGRVEFLASLAPIAGFRHRVAAEVLGARGPVLLLAAESPALCPAEKAAVLEAAYAPAASGPAAAGAVEQPGEGAAFTHPALTALARSEPQAATVLAELAQRLAAATQDPEDAPRLLAALAPAALRLWGQAPVLTPQSEHASEYRQDESGALDQIGDENTTLAKPGEEDDTLKGEAGKDTLAGGAGQDTLPGKAGNAMTAGSQEGKAPASDKASKSLLINPTGGPIRYNDSHGSGRFDAPRDNDTRQHKGVDYSGQVGAQVKAPMSGGLSVTRDGYVVIESKKDSTGGHYATTLIHVNAKDKADTAEGKVKQGDTVATVQDTKDFVTKNSQLMTPHVHTKLEYITRHGERTVLNPDDYMPNPDPSSVWPRAHSRLVQPNGSRRR